MESTTTSTAQINLKWQTHGGFTLVEVLIAVGIGSIVLATVLSFNLIAARSFCAMGNYLTLNQQSRNALDILSRDIRQANGCSTNDFATTNLTLLMTDPTSGQPYTVNYNYTAAAGTLTRTYTDASNVQSQLLLTNCVSFAFSYYLRNPTDGAWAVFPDDSGQANECKLVRIDWTCARTYYGDITNSETMESAEVVIRKG